MASSPGGYKHNLDFGGLFFDVVDDEDRRGAALLFEFEAELMIDGVE